MGIQGKTEYSKKLLHLFNGDFCGLRVLNAIGADDGMGFIFKRDDEVEGFWKV